MTPLATHTISDFLASLGAKSPAPGGGAAAALTGATAASLARMVVSYSIGKKSLAADQPYLEDTAAALDRAAALFLEFADADAASYATLNQLQKLPDTDPRKIAELPSAVESAVQIPLACASAASDLLRTCERLITRSNRFLRSDLAIAAVLAEAAVSSACWNVRINAPLLASDTYRAQVSTDVARLLRESLARRHAVEHACE